MENPDLDRALTVIAAIATLVLALSHYLTRRRRMSRAHPRFTRANPPLPAATPNTWEISMLGGIEGQLTICTFYYGDGAGLGGLSPSVENGIIGGWKTLIFPAFQAAMSADWTLRGIRCQCLTSPSRVPVTVFYNGVVGGGPTGHEPTTVCVTLLRYGSVKGQAGRGRVSLPGVPSAWVTGSQVNATGAPFYATAATDLGSSFAAGGNTYLALIVSRKNRAGPPLGSTPIMNIGYDATLGSCRRRKLGRGR